MPYKVAFISLGCAKNLVNTEQMMALCRKAGHIVTGDAEGADVAVLNTCGFIESAKSEAIDNILQLAQLKEQGKLKKLLVAGCLTQRYPEDIRTELPEVDGMLGTGSYTDVVAAVEELMAGEKAEHFGDIHRTYEDGERLVTTPPYTAYLKIAEGCSNGCAFCIIPKLRGRYRSRSMDTLLAEAKGLADSGVQELIVIAQDITRYGLDLKDGSSLAGLLKELCKLPFHWIRLHYLYPEAITDELIEVIASQPKILHYLDIPIQHCNDAILKAMRRRNTKAELEELFARLRKAIPDLVIRTSLICGLPGEGEAEFEELCEFLQGAEAPAGRGVPVLPRGGNPGRCHGQPGGSRGGPAPGGAGGGPPVPGDGRVERGASGHRDGGAVRGLRRRGGLLCGPDLRRLGGYRRPRLLHRRRAGARRELCQRAHHRRLRRRPDR